jgi:hypothetical protein
MNSAIVKNVRSPSELDHLFDGCSGETKSILPDGSTQMVRYVIDQNCYGLKPVQVK